jgi:hypothetical protein
MDDLVTIGMTRMWDRGIQGEVNRQSRGSAGDSCGEASLLAIFGPGEMGCSMVRYDDRELRDSPQEMGLSREDPGKPV